MSSAWRKPVRALATHTAAITIIGLGLAAPASAAQGDAPSDQRNDTAVAAQADASEKRSANASGTGSTEGSTESGTTTGPDHSQGNAGTSGDYDAPQPESNADQNDGGANGQCPEGPYCSDRKGDASMNGKGDGEAKGKPCAGCVGKADNKNPQGQKPNGTDHNKGYECDDNQGVGQTNPAHTGCVEGETETETETETPGGETPGGETPGGETPGGVTPPGPPSVIPPGIGGVEIEVPAANRPPVVAGVEMLVPPAGAELTVRPQGEAPQAAAAAAAAQGVPGAAVLPATGAASTVTLLSALAFGLLALGAGTLMYRRVTHG